MIQLIASFLHFLRRK